MSVHHLLEEILGEYIVTVGLRFKLLDSKCL
jgi:hypothetical protein